MKFAIIKTGGKQYRVARGEKIRVEKLELAEGDTWECDDVLLVADDEDVKIGSPNVEGASVEAKVLEQGREKKKIVFKFKRRKRHRRKRGHRQPYTELEVTEIRG